MRRRETQSQIAALPIATIDLLSAGVEDFFSRIRLGWQLPPDVPPHEARLWEGVSVQDSEDSARALARRYPRTGRFIARVEIAKGDPIAYEKTRGHGHFTLWGDPAEVLACAVSVVAV